jgi:hypothetical protein
MVANQQGLRATPQRGLKIVRRLHANFRSTAVPMLWAAE